MASARSPRMVLLLVAAAALSVSLFFMLSSDPGPAPTLADEEPHKTAEASTSAPVAEASVPVEREAVSREVEPAAAEKTAASGLPRSYREALGGLIGRVVEQDGTPVPDLPVELLGGGLDDGWIDPYRFLGDDPPDLDLSVGETRTDEDGRFRFAEVDPRGFFALGLDLGGPRASVRFVEDMPQSGEVRDLGDIVLDGIITFTGRVEDFDGEPVAGARVRATDLPPIIFEFGAQYVRPGIGVVVPALRGSGGKVLSIYKIPPALSDLIDRFPIPTTTTAEDGSFRLEGVPYGMVTVLVDKRDFVPLVHGPVPSGAYGGERSLGVLRIDEGDEISGRVLTHSGAPVAGAEIMVGPVSSLADEASLVWPAGTTREDGTFGARGLTDEEHVVAAREPDGIDWTLAEGVFPGDEVEIRLPETLEARIVAVAPDGSIVQKPALALREFADDGPGEVPIFSPPRRISARVRYDDEGAAIVSGLGPHRYRIMLHADGYAACDLKVDLTGSQRTFRAELQPAHALEVRVARAADDAPVEYAAVAAISRENEILDEMPVSTGRTDESGTALLKGLPEGKYRLRVDHPAYAVTFTEATVPGDGVVVSLREGATITGRVHRGGKPLDEPRWITINHDHEDLWMPRFVVTDLEGNFRFERLTPGEYEVHVLRRVLKDLKFGEVAEKFFSFGGEDPEEREVDVAVAEGEEKVVDIDLLSAGEDAGPTAYLSGRVLINGRGEEGASVQAQPAGEWRHRKNTRTGQGGLFELGEVAIGEHHAVRVAVAPRGASPGFFDAFYQEVIALEPGERRELLFDIRAGEVRGVVRGEDGRPVAEAEVTIQSEGFTGGMAFAVDESSGEPRPIFPKEAQFRHSTRTDAEGRFSFDLTPASRSVVSVDAKGYVDYRTDPFDVPAGSVATPLVIELRRAITVSGRVRLPEGVSADSCWMTFSGRDVEVHVGVNLKDDLTFATDELGPGTYDVEVAIWRRNGDDEWEYESLVAEVTVPESGATDLVIAPVKAAP